LFGETGMMHAFSSDATRARMNIRTAKDTGMPPMFRNGIDDPEIHNAIATDAAKNLDFDNWPPPSQQALLAYIQQVQGIMAQNAMMAQATAPVEAKPRSPVPGPATPAAPAEETPNVQA